ncbi:MAG: hypothetical protein EBW21_02855 [Actinobacteria bacterium]|nr:hypothetical protein [Actinomycetota bacterium]
MKRLRKLPVIALLSAALLVVSSSTVNATGNTIRVNGASSLATFLDKCKASYATATGDQFTGYTAVGSGGGKTQFGAGNVDIGLSDSENKNADKPAGMLHIPFVAWPVSWRSC